MQFTITRADLAAALSKLFAVTPKKATKEILKYVRAEVQGESLILNATDEEISLQMELAITDGADGACLLSQKVVDICREARGEAITLEVKKDQKLHVTSGLGDWNLQTDDPAEFPKFPSINNEEPIDFSAKLFQVVVDRTIFATDMDSTRYALGGICLQYSKDVFAFAATDGRRLSLHTTTGLPARSDFRVVVPSAAMRAVQGICERTEWVRISPSAHCMEFDCGTAKIHSRLVEGRFPKYEDVIPDSHEFECVGVVGPFLSAVRQAMIVTTVETAGVSFQFKSGQLTLQSAAGDVGKSKIDLPIQSEGTIDVTLDPKFVADFLKTLKPEDSVRIKLIDSNSAVVMESDGTVYVVMPLAQDR